MERTWPFPSFSEGAVVRIRWLRARPCRYLRLGHTAHRECWLRRRREHEKRHGDLTCSVANEPAEPCKPRSCAAELPPTSSRVRVQGTTEVPARRRLLKIAGRACEPVGRMVGARRGGGSRSR